MSNTIIVRIQHLPGTSAGAGLEAFADAVVLAHASPVLDEALKIAHDLAAEELPAQARRRALEDTASTLLEQLRVIQDQLGAA
jgi:hypothetical protein